MKPQVAIATFVAGAMFVGPSSVGQAMAALVTLQQATADFSQTAGGGFPVSETIDGNLTWNNGWAFAYEHNTKHTAVWETQTDLNLGPPGMELTFQLIQNYDYYPNHTLKKVRLSATTADRSWFADGLQTGGDLDPSPGTWVQLVPTSATASGSAVLTINPDNTVFATISNPPETYTIKAVTTLQDITGFRLEVFPVDGGVGYYLGLNAVLTEFTVDAVVIPEPSTFAIWTLGLLLGLVSCRWRRRLSR